MGRYSKRGRGKGTIYHKFNDILFLYLTTFLKKLWLSSVK